MEKLRTPESRRRVHARAAGTALAVVLGLSACTNAEGGMPTAVAPGLTGEREAWETTEPKPPMLTDLRAGTSRPGNMIFDGEIAYDPCTAIPDHVMAEAGLDPSTKNHPPTLATDPGCAWSEGRRGIYSITMMPYTVPVEDLLDRMFRPGEYAKETIGGRDVYIGPLSGGLGNNCSVARNVDGKGISIAVLPPMSTDQIGPMCKRVREISRTLITRGF